VANYGWLAAVRRLRSDTVAKSADDVHALELQPEALHRTCDPASLGFETTAEVEPHDAAIGQRRAREAIAFALGVPTPGYNIFASGPIGTGKRSALQAELTADARTRPDARDVVYVHNFADARRPIALDLAAGRGAAFASAMEQFVEDARRDLVRAFESETHQARRREVVEASEQKRDAAFETLRELARTLGVALELTAAGVLTIPLRDGQPVTRDAFIRMPDADQEAYHRALKEIEPHVQDFVVQTRELEREARERMRELDREAGLFAVDHLVDDLKNGFAETAEIAAWLDAVRDDMIEHLEELSEAGAARGEGVPESLKRALRGGSGDLLAHYQVNAFVSHEAGTGAPVVVETSPTYLNLFGGIEHQGVFGGGFVTDHRFLRAGALHRANGGHLMLPAREVLLRPLLWQRLKDVLQTRKARLENLGDQYALLPTTTLQPEPLDLDVKVALYGPPPLYELAWRFDDDVRKLFRVKVEFEPRIPWTDDNVREYAAFLSAEVQRADLLPLDAGATARIVEQGARLAGHRDWLSTRALEIAGLAAEASHWAVESGSATVSADHVARALEERRRRSDLTEERLLSAVRDGTLMIDVEGTRVGQVNGLAVIDLGDYAFGHPVRITATTGIGKGDLVSIEREVELSGPIHNKGFLVLRGFLENRYGGAKRLALAAHLTFEQSYEEIEGDSAAAAELYALLSDLAAVPLRQDIAVTGSVNQHGELQAIGGVNEKIEGFWRACRAKRLTGSQGVVIPAPNVQHLMLSPELVDAARRGEFHVWSASTIDEGLDLLTGSPAETLHERVRERLAELVAVTERAERRARRAPERDGRAARR
jgi:lon-related putative ATP-dependent protease